MDVKGTWAVTYIHVAAMICSCSMIDQNGRPTSSPDIPHTYPGTYFGTYPIHWMNEWMLVVTV